VSSVHKAPLPWRSPPPGNLFPPNTSKLNVKWPSLDAQKQIYRRSRWSKYTQFQGGPRVDTYRKYRGQRTWRPSVWRNTLGKVIKMLVTLLAPEAFDRVVAVCERQAQRYIDWFDKQQGVVKAIAKSDFVFANWLAVELDDPTFHRAVRVFRDVALRPAVTPAEEFLSMLPPEVQLYLDSPPRQRLDRFIADLRRYEGSVKRAAALTEMEVIGLDLGENIARLLLELALRFIRLGKPKV